jgi:O-antigen/teichoic acid export membrane protein
MASIFISFLSMFSEFGLGSAVIQKAAIDDATLQRVFGLVLVIHFSMAALLMLAAPVIAGFFAEERLVAIIRVLALQFLVIVFGVIPDALLQRRMQFRGRALFDLSAAVIGSMVTLALAVAGHGVWALVISALISQTWKTIGVNALAPYFHRPDFSLNGMRSLIRFGGHVTASQVLWSIVIQLDVLIGGKWLGKEVLGFYSVAMHLASLPIQRISGIINQIAFPAFARIQHDVHKVGTNLLLGTRLLSFAAFPILWGVSSIAPEIVNVLLGPKWVPAILPLQILALVMPVRMITNFGINAMQGLGRSDIIMRNAIFATLVTPIAFFIGVSGWGLLGLSVAWLVASPMSFLQGMIRTMHALDLGLGRLLAAMAPSACSGVLMYAAVSLSRELLPDGVGGIARMCLLILAGAVTYIVASVLFNRRGLREVISTARSLTTLGGGSSSVE